MKDNREQKSNRVHGKEPVRLVALSDGLFATVLTLLVLDLRIPDAINAGGGNISVFLKWLGPHLFSYLLTFLVTATYWLAHHRDFDQVVGYDRSLLGYNLLFLLFIGLLPFTTASVSLPTFKSSAYPFYWAIYATNIILAGIMLTLTWNYAVSHHLVTPETTRQKSRHNSAVHLVTPIVFLISIASGYLLPQFFLGPYTLLLIPFRRWLVDRHYADAEVKRTSRHADLAELAWRAGTVVPWLIIIGLAIWVMSK